MNTEENDNRHGKMNTPTQEAKLVVELNSDILKTIHSLQAELHNFREDSLNERKEHQAINETLLRNLTGGSLQRKPTHSINRSKREPYHKWDSSPREEEKEEHTPEAIEGDHHSPSSDDSLSPCRKRQRNDDNLQGSSEK